MPRIAASRPRWRAQAGNTRMIELCPVETPMKWRVGRCRRRVGRHAWVSLPRPSALIARGGEPGKRALTAGTGAAHCLASGTGAACATSILPSTWARAASAARWSIAAARSSRSRAASTSRSCRGSAGRSSGRPTGGRAASPRCARCWAGSRGRPARVAALCACGQMHGTVLVDDDGRPTREAVPLWNDKRTLGGGRGLRGAPPAVRLPGADREPAEPGLAGVQAALDGGARRAGAGARGDGADAEGLDQPAADGGAGDGPDRGVDELPDGRGDRRLVGRRFWR